MEGRVIKEQRGFDISITSGLSLVTKTESFPKIDTAESIVHIIKGRFPKSFHPLPGIPLLPALDAITEIVFMV
jgi:hypothetical protein